MDTSYDPAKSWRNMVERSISFELVREFDWSDAIVIEDKRKDYGESRYQAFGCINGRLHVLVFTPRSLKLHVISARKANSREVKFYEKTTRS
jgi:uncharacterized DUF497 family protein